MQTTNEIWFKIDDKTFTLLKAEAARLGFRHVNGAAKAIFERGLGQQPTVSALGENILLTVNERAFLEALLSGPKMVSELNTTLHKQHSNMSKLAKDMAARNWIVPTEMRATKGRPAVVYEISDSGRARYDLDTHRRNAKKETAFAEATKTVDAYRMARKPLRRLPNPDNDPVIAWRQAAVDAYVKKFPYFDRDCMIEAVAAIEYWVLGEVFCEATTWEREAVKLLSDGWVWREDGHTPAAEYSGVWKPTARTPPEEKERWEREQLAEKMKVAQ